MSDEARYFTLAFWIFIGILLAAREFHKLETRVKAIEDQLERMIDFHAVMAARVSRVAEKLRE